MAGIGGHGIIRTFLRAEGDRIVTLRPWPRRRIARCAHRQIGSNGNLVITSRGVRSAQIKHMPKIFLVLDDPRRTRGRRIRYAGSEFKKRPLALPCFQIPALRQARHPAFGTSAVVVQIIGSVDAIDHGLAGIHGIALIGALAVFQKHALIHGIQAVRGIGTTIQVANRILNLNQACAR